MMASSPAASTIPPCPCSGGWDSSSERCSRTTCRIRSAITTACSSCSTRTGTSRAPCDPAPREGRAKESDVPSILLKTEVPGPKSRAMLARRAASAPTGLSKATDVVVERAEGALVHDVDGNTFIDFVGGIGALAVGGGHPVRALGGGLGPPPGGPLPPRRRRRDARGGAAPRAHVLTGGHLRV